MSPVQKFYRSIGVRQHEVRTVWLFFLHNFFLGIGTILAYVSANVILLENHPETSLPIAFIGSAIGMMLVGKLYAHYEHHLALRSLAVRVLWAVIALTFVLAVLVLVGHSVWAAIAIMVGYRLIYLLTSLEFWGVSAVVFDVRQSKRLFSVISSGDMPAKALGAILAALVHAHTDMFFLLLVAFGSFLAAIYMLRLTYRSHDIHTSHGSSRVRQPSQSRIVEQLFGNSQLITLMCLSLVAVATVAASVEYAFFINVKYKIHATTSLLQYVSQVLALTYLVAMLVKVLLSRRALDRLGVRQSLQLLPQTAFVAVLVFAAVYLSNVSESAWLLYYCALYLAFEVIRRSLFDPVFLVLFQPLSTSQRLQGHTLVKGFYEPLGMALAGILLYAFHAYPELNEWAPFVWMGLGTLVAFWLLGRTYRHYLNELKSALSRRFLETNELAAPDEVAKLILRNLKSDRVEEVINAIDWLKLHRPDKLADRSTKLLQHPDAQVRRFALEAFTDLSLTADASVLYQLATQDAEPAIRELASRLYSGASRAEAKQVSDLLHHTDLIVRKGAILGSWKNRPFSAQAAASFNALSESSQTADRLAVLDIIRMLQLEQYDTLVSDTLTSSDADVTKAAIRTAGVMNHPALTRHLVNLLTNRMFWRSAAQGLSHMQEAALPFLENALQTATDSVLIRRIAGVCAKIRTPESHQLLTSLISRPDLSVRTAALKALSHFEFSGANPDVYHQVLQEELKLAQRLLHGSLHKNDKELLACLDYEMGLLLQRVFFLLMQLYDRDVIASVRTGIDHASRERRANALEMLDNLIPRVVYQCLQAMVDEIPMTEKVRLIDAQLGVFQAAESLLTYILDQGETVFSAWTISVAMRRWRPRSLPNAQLLGGYLHHSVQLLSESANGVLQVVQVEHPDWYQRLLADYPTISVELMKSIEEEHISDFERVIVLKNTRLFADTPENILSTIAPIMKEVQFQEGQTIFEKGEIGNCMFVIYSGAVDIYDRQERLAQFERGDVFGELALLDTEPRSASAIAASEVLLFRIDHEDFYDLMEEREEVLRNMMRILCQRIRLQNEKLQTLAVRPDNG
ncbi:Cyclic nucleotide-binding domain-containing protein [Larkinella arboricola]|uniref:Cyclic nucleotide-binding domain-containing protein n=1 Tax=Larkinella arboricola TaxID=643671 RepID=A0A327WLU7_LARAB|nr:cyclic nucleotide-binding domain-containing protein [Larkinella arboricola]RAJ92104.1 Cyclic nucleotide-binding domain-containing protein [Larkinella arboricola]